MAQVLLYLMATASGDELQLVGGPGHFRERSKIYGERVYKRLTEMGQGRVYEKRK